MRKSSSTAEANRSRRRLTVIAAGSLLLNVALGYKLLWSPSLPEVTVVAASCPTSTPAAAEHDAPAVTLPDVRRPDSPSPPGAVTAPPSPVKARPPRAPTSKPTIKREVPLLDPPSRPQATASVSNPAPTPGVGGSPPGTSPTSPGAEDSFNKVEDLKPNPFPEQPETVPSGIPGVSPAQ